MNGTRTLTFGTVGWLAGSAWLCAPGACPCSAAPLGTTFTFQGQLRQNGAVVDDICACQFSLWDAPTAGAQVGATLTFDGQGGNPPPISIKDGLLTVELDFGAVFDGQARWLEIAVACPAGGPLTPLSPRQPLTAVPYALHTLSGPDIGSELWAANGDDIYNTNPGRMGIGASNPSRDLEIRRNLDGIVHAGVRNLSTGSNAQALLAVNADDAQGSFAAYSSNYTSATFRDRAVLSSATNASGLVLMATGSSADLRMYTGGAAPSNERVRITSSGQIGVGSTAPTARLHVTGSGAEPLARFQHSSGVGSTSLAQVVLESSAGLISPIQSRLILEAESNTGAGANVTRIRAENRDLELNDTLVVSADGAVGIGTDAPAWPLHVETSETAIDESTAAALVRHTATDGPTVGLQVEVASPQGVGVYAHNRATTAGSLIGGPGVLGRSDTSNGVGVLGEGYQGVLGQSFRDQGTGVVGLAIGARYGVYGSAVGTGNFAVYAQGDAHVTGTLTKSGGAFKIDHPLDPGGKFLAHAFVESPDMKNVYDGVVTLDAAGRAQVQLPEYFEALNRDFRYQLTAIGAPAPELHIASEIRDGRFEIAGGKPGQKVSWQVTGIRKDRWAQANPIIVEQPKPAAEAGKYLHPELYAAPPGKRLHPAPAAVRDLPVAVAGK